MNDQTTVGRAGEMENRIAAIQADIRQLFIEVAKITVRLDVFLVSNAEVKADLMAHNEKDDEFQRYVEKRINYYAGGICALIVLLPFLMPRLLHFFS